MATNLITQDAPAWRDDVKGKVRETIADFEAQVRGELGSALDFIVSVDDTDAYNEYKRWLTHDEMARAFRRAIAKPGSSRLPPFDDRAAQ